VNELLHERAPASGAKPYAPEWRLGDRWTTRHPGYASSQRVRSWIKTVAGLDRPKLRGMDRIGWAFTFAAAA
jgi:hypothetical protein